GPPFGEGLVAQKLLWHLVGDARPVQSLRAEVPAELAELIERMLAKTSAERPEPAEVAELLTTWATPLTESVVTRLAPAPRSAPPSRSQTPPRGVTEVPRSVASSRKAPSSLKWVWLGLGTGVLLVIAIVLVLVVPPLFRSGSAPLTPEEAVRHVGSE